MTNHWNDIDNTSLVFAYGANPAENHPACMAHVNAARFSTDFGTKKAKLIVVDPRLTRTARQCDPARGDRYVRIRPGTNVAFTNGLMKWIFDNIASYNASVSDNMLAWHNGTVAGSTNYTSDSTKTRTFVSDTGATLSPLDTHWNTASYAAISGTPLATGYPKYCDTRFLLKADATDYARGTLNVAGGAISDFPIIAQTVTSQVVVGLDTLDTVWTSLKAHLAPYDTATVADICGCTEADIIFVAQALIDHSRFASTDFLAGMAANGSTPKASGYRATTILYAMGQTQHTNGSQNIKDLAIIQTLMGNMGRAGGGINALRGIHNVQGSTDMGLLYDSIPAYGDNPGKSDATETFGHYLNGQFGNRLTGNTAAIKAALTLRGTASFSGASFTAQTAGTSGNSIRVSYVDPLANNASLSVSVSGLDITVNLATGATGLITTIASEVVTAVNTNVDAFALVKAAIVGANGTDGSGVVIAQPLTYLSGGTATLADLTTVAGKLGLQQRGFYNMTTEWFGNGLSSGADVQLLYNLWPKGDGVQHIQTFRNMTLPVDDANRIISSLIWGQNPAITEPNQSKVRAGLKALDLMVVVDMYETETAACDRKSGGVTYLIPACSHAEEAGSVTNSGRWLQWRERATAPKGNSKADLELLLHFAYALDKAGAFSHITNVPYSDPGTGVPTAGVWSTLSALGVINGPAYKVLYGDKYHWTPRGATAFEAVTRTGGTERWAPGATSPISNYAGVGSEIVAEDIYKEMCRPTNYTATTGGTMWIYSGSDSGALDIGGGTTPGVGGWNNGVSYNGNYMPAVTSAGNTVAWTVKNRAKSRNNVVTGQDGPVGANNYPRWGWAWLLNRRVFYNNGEVAGDQSDTFVAAGLVALLYTPKSPTAALDSPGLADWSLVYRKYKTFKDAPSTTTGPHFLNPVTGGKTFMGRFPGHTEPYESPAVASNPAFLHDYVALYGHNMSGSTRLIVEGADGSAIGTYGDPAVAGQYPLVLTSIRCVEHFQGGPITRNNSWNVEAEPVPWIEINAADARTYGIADGDWVNVTTARGNSQASQELNSPNSALPGGKHWARGFKARVGVGLESNQRVARGVVAIPWHWGDKGLSTGSRANDLCIDAWDANSTIPEYKACLCKIEKMS